MLNLDFSKLNNELSVHIHIFLHLLILPHVLFVLLQLSLFISDTTRFPLSFHAFLVSVFSLGPISLFTFFLRINQWQSFLKTSINERIEAFSVSNSISFLPICLSPSESSRSFRPFSSFLFSSGIARFHRK